MRNGGRSLDIVHCIINSVSAHLAASALLAYGASPVMADAQEEMREIEEKSDALYINLGMLHEEKKRRSASRSRRRTDIIPSSSIPSASP